MDTNSCKQGFLCLIWFLFKQLYYFLTKKKKKKKKKKSNSTTYEIAGRGGFLAMSSSGGQITDDFQFSLDFGQSFESCPLPDSFVNVTLHNFLSRSFGKPFITAICCKHEKVLILKLFLKKKLKDHDTFLLDGELQNGAGLLAKVTLSPKLKSCGKPLLSDGSLGTNYDTFSPGHCLLGKHVEVSSFQAKTITSHCHVKHYRL